MAEATESADPEARRPELLAKLLAVFSPEGEDIHSIIWAFLWGCEISCLESLTTKVNDLELFSGLSTPLEDIILPWMSKPTGRSKTTTPVKSVAARPADSSPLGPRSKRLKIATDVSPRDMTQTPYQSSPILSPLSPENLPTPGPARTMARDGNLRDMTFDRDRCCVLTKIATKVVLAHAHFYAFSLGKAEQKRSFWNGLRLFWPEEVVGAWSNILGTAQGTERLVNTIMLNCTSHKAWDAALFAFKFVSISEDKRTMDLKFYWLPRRCKESEVMVSKEDFLKPPQKPSEETVGPRYLRFFNVRTGEPIKSGDVITLFTDDPVDYPLPSPEIIELQWHLHQIAALSAAAIDDHVATYCTNDDDNDDNGDDYDSLDSDSTKVPDELEGDTVTESGLGVL